MRCRKFALAVAVVAWLAASNSAQTAETLSVVAGQSRIERVPGVTQVAVGDARIADVKSLSRGDDLMLTGLRPGMTTLTVWRGGKSHDYLVRVLAHDPRLVAEDLKTIVADIPGVDVKTAGERVMLTGKVLRARDYVKIETIAKLYPDVLNFVEPNYVDLDRLIRVNVSLVEIARSSSSELGIAWPDALGVGATATFGSDIGPGVQPMNGTIVLSTQLAASLKAMSGNGRARILANPTLVGKNGEKASFEAGGSLPVPVNSGLGQTSIQWYNYGIELGVLPHVDQAGNFHLELEVGISDLDPANAIKSDAGTIPAIRRRATKSNVNLAAGEALVLAELVDLREGKSVSRVPGLGSLPILGELFRSRKLSRQETEVYIIITPSQLRPGSLPGDEVADRQRRYEQAADSVKAKVLEKP